MCRLRTLITSILIIVFIGAYGQEQTQLPLPEVPLTPEAAAFAKYGDVPVNHSTGVTNISIPIYELKLKNFVLPIGLRYHSGGFRTDEIASDVGLGWTLDGFGMISQSIRGLKDNFDGSSGYNAKREILDLVDADNNTAGSGFLVCETGDACGPSFFSPTGDKPRNHDNIYFGLKDSEPDQFNLNLPGLSGTFFINKQGEFVTNKASQISIAYETANQRFIVRNEKGIEYIFQDREILTTENSCEGASPFYTPRKIENYSPNYYLSSICLPQGGCIYFEYENYSYKYTTNISQTDFHPGAINTCFDEITIKEGKKISRIYSDNGFSIDFIYAKSQRIDLPRPINELISGELVSVVVSASGNEVLRHDLKYDVSYGATNPHLSQYVNLTDFNHNSRLMLRSVQRQGENPHVFEYMSDSQWGLVRLPSRFSFAKDYWGFYNQQESNTTLVPAANIFEQGMGTADRSPDPNSMKANLLKRINYPTGGHTIFHYEPHQRTIIPDPDSNGCVEIIRDKSISMSSVGDEGPNSVFFNKTPEMFDYWVNYNTNVPVANTEQLLPVFGEPFSSCFIGDQLVFSIPQQGVLDLPNGSYELVLHTAGFTDDLDENFNPIPAETNITISWKERDIECPTGSEPIKKTLIYGGLRIKSIYSNTDESSTEQSSVSKLFEYSHPVVNNDIYVDNAITNDYHYFDTYRISQTDPVDCILNSQDPYYGAIGRGYDLVYSLSSESQYPLSFASGGSMKYGEVAEIIGPYQGLSDASTESTEVPDGNFFGKTIYIFDYYENHKRGGGIEDDYSWLGGDILSERSYAFVPEENDYVLVKQRSYYYTPHDITLTGSSDNYQEIWGLRVSRTHPPFIMPSGSECLAVVPRYKSSFYKVPSIWKTLDRVIETSYDGRSVRLQTDHYYDVGSMQRWRQSVTENSIRELNYYYFYPHDMPAGHPVASQMQLKNMLSQPIYLVKTLNQVTTPEGSLLENTLDIKHFTYQSFDNHIRLTNYAESTLASPIAFSPSIVEFDNILNNSSKETKLSYDDFGYVTEVAQNGEMRAYIWDANESIIAEVNNAGTDQVYHTSFEVDGVTGKAKTGQKYWAGANFDVPINLFAPNLKMSYWYWQNDRWNFSGELDFTPSINSSGSRLDEIRVYPAGSMMTTYTYEPGIGISSVTDSNGVTSFYKYDDGNRLKSVSDDNENLLQLIQYKYQLQNN